MLTYDIVNLNNQTLIVFYFKFSGLTPRKPVNLEAHIVENINIRVHWDPPLNSNVRVTGYWVYFKPDNVKDYQHVSTVKFPLKLIGKGWYG